MLKYNVRGENIEVTDALRSYVEKAVKQVREVLRIESRCDCTRKLKSLP
jgi:Ribosome-associated protein Y (PSrp-1)